MGAFRRVFGFAFAAVVAAGALGQYNASVFHTLEQRLVQASRGKKKTDEISNLNDDGWMDGWMGG